MRVRTSFARAIFLGKIALDEYNLPIAIRCYGQLGDISKVRYLQKAEWVSLVHKEEHPGEDPMSSLKAKAMIAQLKNDLELAEQLYMEENDFDSAIEMYTKVRSTIFVGDFLHVF